ncbi:YihY/virulence factor BrkB family protein [Pseudorhodoferax sp. Leaf267]|uniref:YihY/virulence factor BrkB family protein n=1 Tax=Pseudorhodoferax sp. Leaf267 TaxID=1736316 RepID=UPI000701552D|nr:YihY/virulence factor BrkB family protein [Pseudorhodoferax sp. Leaf267]KQP15179.1 ribonuclease BN [Pseudorhodoferax sp. Leaf267]
MKMSQWLDVCKKTVNAWSDDFAPSMGAAISYYTMFSLAPLLVLVIAIAGFAFGAEAVRGQISSQLSTLMGPDTAQAIEGMIESASLSDNGWWASALSVVVLLVGATSVFAELQSALDRIWHVPESQKPSGVWGILRARLFSMGLILGLAFLLMVSLAVSAGLAAFGSYLGGLLPGQEAVLQILNTVVSLAVMTLLFAMIFKLMPTAKVAWRDVWVGAVVTAALFEAGKFGIGMYLGKSGLSESFAGAGALVILLAWVYYAAQIFLLGAEFTKVYAQSHGSAQSKRAAQPAEIPTKSTVGTDQSSGQTPTASTLLQPSDLRQRLVAASAEALPRLVLLGAITLLRVMADTKVKEEEKLLRAARRRAG